MIRKIIILFLALTSLYGDSLIDIKVEMGLYAPDTSGTIENTSSSSDFEEDYGYVDLKASYFAVDTVIHKDYIPNLKVSYFTMNDNQNSEVNATVRDEVFVGPVTTTLDYSVVSGVVYQDFKIKGDTDDLFYSGDIEFDIGVDIKMIEWKFNIENSTQNSWIKASEILALPYLGFKYYLYDLIVYANASALAFGNAESESYNIGMEYQVVDNLYMGVAYMYEHFEVLEKTDTVDFETSGYKASFKYVF